MSFSGADRDIAREIARGLGVRGFRVFYDELVRDDIWGSDLTEYLQKVYGSKSRYCLVLASASYVSGPWPRFELRHALARHLNQDGYLLVVRLDGTSLPGLPETYCYLDYVSERQVADLLGSKLDEGNFHDQKRKARSSINRLASDSLLLEGEIWAKSGLKGPSDVADSTGQRDDLARLLERYDEAVSDYASRFREYYDPRALLGLKRPWFCNR